MANSHSLGHKPKGQFRLPINSHYPFPRVPEGSFECHSCLVMNHIANARHAHTPKVEDSNPLNNPFNRLRGFEAHRKLQVTPDSNPMRNGKQDRQADPLN